MNTEAGGRFQILSLDGGGIKGLFSAAVLAKIEDDRDVRIADHFDLITGTSPGIVCAEKWDTIMFRTQCLSGEPWKWFAPLSPYALDQRMHAQQGVFLFANDPSADMRRAAKRFNGKNVLNPMFLKLVIPASQKVEILHSLFAMNINAASLFPGIDGVGRYLREAAHMGWSADLPSG